MIGQTLSAAEITWAALFAGLWLLVGCTHLWSLRTGRIIGLSAARRDDRPMRFWLAWFALAWPFVFLPAFIALGFLLQLTWNY